MFLKKVFIFLAIFFIGFFSAYVGMMSTRGVVRQVATQVGLSDHQVIGFLPYWLISRADKDYTPFISTLTYFGLTIKPDGSIRQYTKPGEKEPGWLALESGKVDTFLAKAKENHQSRSLLVFNGSQQDIDELVGDPITHADTLMKDIAPIMKQYGFTDLNLDIESVAPASESAREQFTQFVRQVKTHLSSQQLGTLSIDVSPSDMIHTRLTDVASLGAIADYLILMAYDYHYQGSIVTGPVAPIGGAGTIAEYDTQTALQKAIAIVPKKKIMLGIPLYGYEWETIGDQPRFATLPGSGIVTSNRRFEELQANCATCSAQFDTNAKESYIIFTDRETGMVHQIFSPDERSTKEKIALANGTGIGGMAVWALGYEGSTILEPFRDYLKQY